jgi:hypothetical protein
MARLGRDRFIWYAISKDAVDEFNLESAQRRLQRHAISAIGALGQADDEDLFELFSICWLVTMASFVGRLEGRGEATHAQSLVLYVVDEVVL